MNPEIQKVRDELLYEQVKGNRSLCLGLAITYGACVLMTIGFAVGIVALGKGIGPFLADLGAMIGSAGAAYSWWQSYKEADAALEEIGDDPTGISTRKTYSKSTAWVIGSSRLTKKELRQQWIAYGIIAIVMLFFAVFFFAMAFSSYSDESLFVFCCAFMLGGGILLSSLTIRAFREWLIARRLEALEEAEGIKAPGDFETSEAPDPSETPAASDSSEAPTASEQPAASDSSEAPAALEQPRP